METLYFVGSIGDWTGNLIDFEAEPLGWTVGDLDETETQYYLYV